MNQTTLKKITDSTSGPKTVTHSEELTPVELSRVESTEKMVPGGLGEVLQKDDEVMAVVEKIKPIFEEKTGTKFESLEIIHYRPQVVAGRNYFIKAKAKHADSGREEIVHLRIYQNLQKELELTAYRLEKTLDDKLEYFQ